MSAEDRGVSRAGRLYEIVLMPLVARAMHRKRSRIFFERTLREIVEAVLTGDPRMTAGETEGEAPHDLRAAFQVPQENFAWRIKEPGRIDDPKVDGTASNTTSPISTSSRASSRRKASRTTSSTRTSRSSWR